MNDDDKPDEPDNLVDLFAEPTDPIVGARGTKFDCCKHRQIDLVMKTCVAECRACKHPVDLFQWMYANTEYFRRAHANYKNTKREVVRLAAQEKDLKRLVKNLKAQAQRWEEKLQRLQRETAEPDVEVRVLDCKRKI